ncbi:GAF domain-containing protein [Nocardioides sp. SOB77]|uniref:GAF domain-containing protein n=1 Tax=Nocardioides oceani TaxID=3058369 RepID=A0ABT8FL27_9ACTN|nr:GAF domain-containing protein [Nocardioides oceani]MDN4175383.1 GAF domain-containing protein [Nocardioides oceani]
MTDLQHVVATVREACAAAACSCALLDPAGERLVFVAADGAGATAVVGLELPVGRGLAGWAVLTGQSIAVADVSADRRFDRAAAESTAYVPTTVLASPLLRPDGGVAGVLEVLDPEGPPRLALVDLVAGLVAGATTSPVTGALARAAAAVSAAGPAASRLAVRLLDAVVEDHG